MKKFLFLFLLLPLLSFNTLHKFYVSVTDIEYNEKNETLQIISSVFTDDLEELLKERYSKELFLLKKGEHAEADKFVKRYFQDKLQIRIDGQLRELKYIGKEYDKDELLVYLEVTEVQPFKSITVENAVLIDLFPEQKNVIKVENKGSIKSLLLTRNAVRGSLNFNE